MILVYQGLSKEQASKFIGCGMPAIGHCVAVRFWLGAHWLSFSFMGELMRIGTKNISCFRIQKFLLPSPSVIGLLSLFSLSLISAGCASITLSGKDGARGQVDQKIEIVRGASERQALVAAVSTLDQTPWPQIEKISLRARMAGSLFGGDKNPPASSMTREQAIEIYLNQLMTDPQPTGQLLLDADTTLTQARQVAESGRLAARAMRPQSGDIKVLENAIANVRTSRNIYLAAMSRLKKQGIYVQREDMSDIKDAFSQTMRDIGLTANILAERLAAEKTLRAFAESKIDKRK